MIPLSSSQLEKESISELFKHELELIEAALPQYFSLPDDYRLKAMESFVDSINYSLLSGGKRFRPLLALLTAQALDKPPSVVLPWAAAVEFIHTYSLIHDDLPAMDNDEWRRGKATNHVVFGEAVALLAGDALLTEAFGVLAKAYEDRPQIGLKAVAYLAQAVGWLGMVGGQILDIAPIGQEEARIRMEKIHELKTGALIAVSCEGAAMVCEASPEVVLALRTYGKNLGLAFQLADDILDFDPSNPEPTSFVNIVGLASTQKYLQEVTEQTISSLSVLGENGRYLQSLARFNLERSVTSL